MDPSVLKIQVEPPLKISDDELEKRKAAQDAMAKFLA